MRDSLTIKTFTSTLVLTGLLGFSSAGLAQSKAIESLDGGDIQPARTVTAVPHPEANRLASELDAFNNRNQANRGLQADESANTASPHISDMARALARQVTDYNGNTLHKASTEPKQPATPMADQLASEVSTYNQTGGSQIN